ncbi:MAG: hypothetical protein IIY80_01925, partial [Aeriscardovia sp.]|nr:hypothetical protein [Aeriscardovia sp.]
MEQNGYKAVATSSSPLFQPRPSAQLPTPTSLPKIYLLLEIWKWILSDFEIRTHLLKLIQPKLLPS